MDSNRKGTEKYTEEAMKTAIRLSRLWGIAETLEDIPIRDEKEITEHLMEWTQEYMDTGNEDIVKFFLRKKEACRNV